MIQIRTYENIKHLMLAASELILYHYLEEDIEHGEITSQGNGPILILRPLYHNHLPINFAKELCRKLNELTGHPWTISMTAPEEPTIDNASRIQVLKAPKNDKLYFDMDLCDDNPDYTIENFKEAIPDAIYYFTECTDKERDIIKKFVNTLKSKRQIAKMLDVFNVEYSVY